MPEHKSGDEIERVFKVRQLPKNLEQYPCENIVQGYLAIDVTGSEVRLRKIGDRYFETYKGAGRLQRRELEIELSPDQFNTLWLGTEGRGLRKSVTKSTREAKKSSSTYFREIWKVWCLPKSSFPHGRKAKNLSLPIGSVTK
jgi:hypothetical protein